MHLFIANKVDTVTHGIIDNGAVAVASDGTIAEVATSQYFEKHRKDLFEKAIKLNGIIVPGFVNVHCHIELSHLKSRITQHKGLNQFLTEVEAYRDMAYEIKSSCAIEAISEMVREGIVAVGDICNSTLVGELSYDTTLRIFHFVETYAIDAAKAEAALSRVIKTRNAFASNNSSIVPHAPYSVSHNLMEGIINYTTGENQILSIHNQETQGENEMFVHGTGPLVERLHSWGIDLSSFKPTGKHALYSYLPMLAKAKRVLLVHNTYTAEEDVLWAMNTYDNVYWAFCVRANMFIENKLPPLEYFLAYDDKICIGTDSLASNLCLSIIREMQVMQQYLLEKFPHLDPMAILHRLIKWGTYNGAVYLGYNEDLGGISAGKKPGINIIENLSDTGRITNDTCIRKIV